MAAAAAVCPRRDGPRGQILVVDDREDSCKFTISAFEGLGYVCQGCHCGETALEILSKAEGRFSVCVLDQELRGTGHAGTDKTMTGMNTLREITSRFPMTRVIVFTAYEDRGTEALRSGASFYVNKPASMAHLASLVDALVKMRHLEDEVTMTAEHRDRLQEFMDATGVEVMVRDTEYNIVLMNSTKKKNLGLSDDVIGKKCYEVFEGKSAPCKGCPSDCAFGRNAPVLMEWPWKKRTLLISTGPVNRGGKVVGFAEVVVDITRRKKATDFLSTLQGETLDSVSALAERVVGALYDQIGYGRVRLYLRSGDRFVGTACRGMGKDFDFRRVTLAPDDALAAKAFKTGQAVLLEGADLQDDPCAKTLGKEGVTSQIQVPLISAGRTLGLISIDNKDVDKGFTQEDVDVMTFLGAAVASALLVADAIEEKNRQIRWLQLMRDIDQELTVARNAQCVFQAVADKLTEVLRADSAWILFRRGTQGPMEVSAIAGDLRKVRPTPHPGDIGIVSRCLRTNETQIVNDVWADEDFCKFYDSLPKGSSWKRYVGQRKAVLTIPIRRGREPIGVCTVHFSQEIQLTEEEKGFVEAIAARAAIALAKLEDERRIEAAAIQKAKLGDVSLLSAGVAHSVRNPIQSALSAINLAAKEQITNRAGEKLTEANKELLRAADTITRLIDWTRPQGQALRKVAVAEVIRDVHGLVAEKLKNNNIKFRMKQGRKVHLAFVAPDAIKMAILDMFVNATRVMQDGGVLAVTVNGTRDRKSVRVRIEDTGCGMSEEQVAAIFDGRLVDAPPPGGLGLGLYLAQKVIADAGGSIECNSKPGKGTCFTITLPTGERVEP